MTDLGPPPDSAEIYALINEVLRDLELHPNETSEILSFANREVPHLQTPQTSYLILSSYREPLIRQMRAVQDELNKRVNSYAFVLGDKQSIDAPRLPVFEVRFAVLASYADYIVALYEQDAGGEAVELGVIASSYFEKSFVFPRDYDWMTDRNLRTQSDILAAGISIYYNEDLNSAETERELRNLIKQAQRNDIEMNEDDLVARIEERKNTEDEAASYSWPHLSKFRLFELHDQCFSWSTREELRDMVADIL